MITATANGDAFYLLPKLKIKERERGEYKIRKALKMPETNLEVAVLLH